MHMIMCSGSTKTDFASLLLFGQLLFANSILIWLFCFAIICCGFHNATLMCHPKLHMQFFCGRLMKRERRSWQTETNALEVPDTVRLTERSYKSIMHQASQTSVRSKLYHKLSTSLTLSSAASSLQAQQIGTMFYSCRLLAPCKTCSLFWFWFLPIKALFTSRCSLVRTSWFLSLPFAFARTC